MHDDGRERRFPMALGDLFSCALAGEAEKASAALAGWKAICDGLSRLFGQLAHSLRA